MQQNLASQSEALEIAMKLEASPVGETGAGMAQIKSQLANLSIQIKYIKKGKKREDVWCVTCKAEGHDRDHCPVLQEYLATGAPNPLNHGAGPWCEICRTRGHRPQHCYLLQKHMKVPMNLYCKFCQSVGHDE